MTESKVSNKWITTHEVAELFGVHHSTVVRWIQRGELPAIRAGRVYRINKSQLKAYIVRQATAPPIELVNGGEQ